MPDFTWIISGGGSACEMTGATVRVGHRQVKFQSPKAGVEGRRSYMPGALSLRFHNISQLVAGDKCRVPYPGNNYVHVCMLSKRLLSIKAREEPLSSPLDCCRLQAVVSLSPLAHYLHLIIGINSDNPDHIGQAATVSGTRSPTKCQQAARWIISDCSKAPLPPPCNPRLLS